MKKLIFLIFLFFPSISFAALSATVVWEIRSTATAGDLNGAGYDASLAGAGTDYSQQNTAQLSKCAAGCTNTNDLATSGAGATTISSATGGFTSAMVGNIIHITAGTNFQTGWYMITTFTDANDVILDRTPSSGGAGSSGTGYVGGAMSLGSSTLDDAFFENGVGGQKFWAKFGTYSSIGNVSIAAAGTSTNPIWLLGYNTTRGDNPSKANSPTFAMGANPFAFGTGWNSGYINWTGSNASTVASGSNGKTFNSTCINSSTTAGRNCFILGANGSAMWNSEAVSYRGRAFDLAINTVSAYGLYAHDSADCFRLGGGSADNTLINSVGEGCSANGIIFNAATTTGNISSIINNTLYGGLNQTGTGISIPTGSVDIVAINNIITGFSTGINHADSNTMTIEDFNDLFNNGTNLTNVTAGSNSYSTNPQFTNVRQITGTGASSSTNVLTDASANFNNTFTDNQDYVNLTSGSGTGFATGIYLITAHTNTTLTVSSNITTSGSGSAIAYQINYGHNLSPGANVKGRAMPLNFGTLGITTNSLDTGGVQRSEQGNVLIQGNSIVQGNAKIGSP